MLWAVCLLCLPQSVSAKDRNRGITGITYDLSHNPQTIVMNGGQIVNDYTSDGRKLCSTQSTGMTTTTDMYVDGLIIRNGAPLMWQFNGGYVSLGANSVPQSWNYYITDHLGSTRMVVDSQNNIKETINYYPFGSEMTMTPPAQLTSNPNWQPYRFTGKELVRQNGLNMYDFGARWYDVAGVPVWTSMDPLCEKNYPVTPYSYCNGDPVNAIDPDGKKIVIANGSSTKFIQQYETTVNHLKNYGCGDFIDILEKSDVQYIIKENMGNSNYFDYASHEKSWNPTMGLNTDFTILSPATRLNHEFDHAVQYENNPTKYKNDIKPLDDKNPHSLYNTEDDYRVITGSEQKTAEALGEIKTGEVTRMGHYGKPVETISPISNTPINKIEEFEIIGKQKQ